MSFPKVNFTAVMATLDKCCQTPPQDFAAETICELMEEQPDLSVAITALLQMMMGQPDEHADQTFTMEDMQEMILMSSFCILGISLKAINAQTEANEMEEAWGND